eukprot:TRINITY_DN12606_c0_g1_i2.p1 TRINITY_DN12606_c0_g1~~TRINITY_DN12606_c0_g1_i2.p1  ORF type:complete len:444 (-),score=46.90 TRINITY_DN12606_c0_g1_i2:130-1419(-)
MDNFSASDACSCCVSVDGYLEDLVAQRNLSTRRRHCSPDGQYLKSACALVLSAVALVQVVHVLSPTFFSDTHGNSLSAKSAFSRRDFRLLSPEQAEKMLMTSFDKGAICADSTTLVAQLTVMTNNAVLRLRDVYVEAGYSAEQMPVSGFESGQLNASRVENGAGWLVSNSAHSALKITLTGGMCAGKTSSSIMIATQIKKTLPDTLVFFVPEVYAVLIDLGVRPTNDAYGEEFQIQLLVLQLVYEEIWTRYAECITARNANTRAMIAILDRDSLNVMGWSPPNKPDAWKLILQRVGENLGEPGLSTTMLQSRYVGAILFHSIAVLNGHLNEATYNRYCLGNNSSNAQRYSTAIEAMQDDEVMQHAYTEAYPRSKLCFVPASFSIKARAKKAAECAVRFARSAMQDAPPVNPVRDDEEEDEDESGGGKGR